jgi:hypothetical protein
MYGLLREPAMRLSTETTELAAAGGNVFKAAIVRHALRLLSVALHRGNSSMHSTPSSHELISWRAPWGMLDSVKLTGLNLPVAEAWASGDVNHTTSRSWVQY